MNGTKYSLTARSNGTGATVWRYVVVVVFDIAIISAYAGVGLDVRGGRAHEEAADERKRRPHHRRGALVYRRRGRQLVPHC